MNLLLGAKRRLPPWLHVQPERGRIRASSWWLVPALPLLFVIAIVIPYEILYHIAYLWGCLLLVAWLWVRYQGPRVELARELRSNWAQVGDELEERWELYNGSSLPLLWLEVHDLSNVPGYSARRVGSAGANQAQSWTTAAVCQRRGRYQLGPLEVESGDPFGLFRYRRVESGVREMLIYPPLVRLPPLHRPRGERGGATNAALLNVLATPSAGSVRDYRPGDPLNSVHWRAVAHTGRLMVKEFDQEIAGSVWIVLDLARAIQSGEGADATEELAVVLACSLANLLLAEGRTVGLFAHGAEVCMVQPGRGRQHLWQFMSALVDTRADGERALDRVLQELGSATSSRHGVVVVTPDTSGAWVGPLTGVSGGGSAALALLVDTPENRMAPLAGRLSRLGIPHASFQTGEPLPPLVASRRRTSGYRISPLGRAVRTEE